MATIGFLRVSTLDQDTEKNKLDILQFANSRQFGNVEFIEETVSGTKDYKKRKLGALLDRMTKGDILIVPELSRIARSTIQILEVIQLTQDRGITLYSLKENFCNMDNSIASTVTKTIFALVAQIERELISLRTREALHVKFLPYMSGKGKIIGLSYKATIVTIALGLAACHAIWKVSSLSATSKTTSAPL